MIHFNSRVIDSLVFVSRFELDVDTRISSRIRDGFATCETGNFML